jgi:cytochrome c-type biogenesis protein CcmH/NrfF
MPHTSVEKYGKMTCYSDNIDKKNIILWMIDIKKITIQKTMIGTFQMNTLKHINYGSE